MQIVESDQTDLVASVRIHDPGIIGKQRMESRINLQNVLMIKINFVSYCVTLIPDHLTLNSKCFLRSQYQRYVMINNRLFWIKNSEFLSVIAFDFGGISCW